MECYNRGVAEVNTLCGNAKSIPRYFPSQFGKSPFSHWGFYFARYFPSQFCKIPYLEFTSAYAITAVVRSTQGALMSQHTILSVGKSYQSPCPVCKKNLSIGGGPSVGGYRYQAHHSPPTEKSRLGQACPGSGSLVTEEELVRLASLWA
jgi:hypothetical protein